MSVEFVDTNILVYAHGVSARSKRERAVELLTRLFEEGNGALSVQVLSEFYGAITRKQAMTSEQAEAIIADLGGWSIHRPGHEDVLKAARLRRRYKLSWWDAMIVNSAIQAGSAILWSENLSDGQRFATVTVRNPFHETRR